MPFLRYDRSGYSEISESLGREKITSTFRNSLCDRYKSSTKNKVARRRLANQKKAEKKRESLFHNPSFPHQHQPQQQQRQQQNAVPMLPSSDESICSSYTSAEKKRAILFQKASALRQQEQRHIQNVVHVLPCSDECVSSSQATFFQPKSAPPQQKQQLYYNNIRGRNSFLDFGNKLFGANDSSNSSSKHSRAMTPAVFEFDCNFIDIEPVPIPELDCSSTSSQSTCSCLVKKNDGFDDLFT